MVSVSVLAGLRKCEAPTPDGTLIFRMFEGCVRCLANMDSDNRTDAANDAIDWFSPILSEINLHVFPRGLDPQDGVFLRVHAETRRAFGNMLVSV